MKKIIFFLFINLLASNDLNFNLTNSYIKYTGNHPLHSWIGISNNFIFDIKFNDGKMTLYVSVRLDSFDSNNENRDSNMLHYVESLKYPIVTFKSDEIYYKSFEDINTINGILNFHGINKAITAKINIIETNSNIIGKCNFEINLSDFNIEKPKLLMLSIEDKISLESRIELTK